MSATPAAAPADGTTPITVFISIAPQVGSIPDDAQVVVASTDGNAVITQPTGLTAPQGNAFVATVRSSRTGTQTLTAALTSGGMRVPIDASAVVTFNPIDVRLPADMPDPNESSLTANPNQVSSDGSTTTLLTLAIRDSYGAPVVGAPVTFTSTGTNNFFSQASGLTNIAGVLTTTLASTSNETKTVTAHMGSGAVSTNVQFSATLPSAAMSTLTAAPSTVSADGTSTSILTFTLLNAEGMPISGESVQWNATGSNDVLTVGSGQTDVNGQATATLASITAETKAISVTSAGFILTQNINFVAGPADGLTSTFSANPNLVGADNSSASILTFTARDAHGNAAAGVAVTFTSTGTRNTIVPSAPTTDSTGVATATFVSATAESKIVTAASGNANLTRTVIFLAGSPNATNSTLSANPTVATADGTSSVTLTVVLQDAEGNPAPGQAVTFSSSGSNNSFGQRTGTTDLTGAFSTTLTSTTAESKTVTAAFSGGSVTTNATFVAGAPSSATTSVSASPSSVTADGTSTTLVTVVVRDLNGNPVGSHLVSLSASGSNNTLTPVSGNTDSSGTLTATLASTTAETKTITAISGSASATASVTFVAGAPSGSTTTFVASPTSVTADGSSQSTLTVTAHDVNGNPVSGQSVSLSSSGLNNSWSPASSGTTNASGVFMASLASTTAQVKTVTAIAGSATKNASVTFTAGAPAAATTTIVANPASVTANGTSTSTITLTVVDAQGNPVPGQAVSLSSSGSSNIFAQTSGSTNGAGVFSTTLASTTAETKAVSATVASVNKSTTVTFTAGAAASSTSTLSANPTSVTADGTSTTLLTFTVKDTWGNPVPNQSVSLSSSGSSNTFNPSSGTTDNTGAFTATLSSPKAETKTITGTAGSAAATTNVTFVAGSVSSTTTTLVANPTSLAADGVSTTTLTTTALDAQGNPVAGQTVTLSATGSTNAFSSNSGPTNASGVFTTTLSSSTAETKTVSSVVDGVTKNTNVTFTTPLVSQTNSTIVASPTSLIADGNATTTITVTVRDGTNSIVVGAAVTMTATGAANTFTPVSGTTNTSGVFTTTLASTQAAVKTVTATVDGAALTTTVTFVAGTASNTNTTLTASPNVLTADGNSVSVLTVLVEDVNGNPVPNQAVSLASSGGNNIIAPLSGNTDATGTFTANFTSTRAQVKTVTATIGTITKTATLTFGPGNPNAAQTTLVAAPMSVTTDSNTTTTLTTTVKDMEGNPVPNQLVSLSGTGTNNVFTPVSGTTDSAGVFTATLSSTTAQAKTVTATVGIVTTTAAVTFTAGVVSSPNCTLVAAPTSLTADGTTTTTLTVTAKDAQGNPIQGQSVVLNGSGSNNTFGAASGSTNSSGIYTTTLSSTLAQTETITATMGVASATAAVTFVAGSPNNVTSSLVASPNTLTADGVAHATLTVTVKDAHGNPVPSQSVSVGSTGTSNTISPLSGTTNAAGIFTATFASTKAEIKVATATIGTVTENASITFTAGSPSSSTTTLGASPTSVTADGNSTTTLTVTVEDTQGNPVGNQNVTLSSTGASNTFTPATGTTNSAGVFTATLASTTAQVKTVTATAGTAAPTASVTFTAGTASSSTCTVTATPGIVTADGVSTTSVVVTAKDAYGNLVPNQTVSVSTTGTGNAWSGTTGTTNALGTWSTTLSSTKAQGETITATIGSATATTSVSFVAGSPNSTYSTLTATPSTVTADGASTTSLQITVADAQNNPITGQAVTFSSTGSTFTLTPGTCSTASGLCSVTLTSTLAQTVTVTASFAGLTKTATVTFVAGAASSTTSTFNASPTSLPDDNTTTTTLQITVEDAHNNPVGSQAVTFSSAGSGYTFSATTCTTAASGICSVTMKSSTAGAVTVTAAFASNTKTAAVTFTTGSASNTTSTLSASPTSLADDNTALSTVQITVLDGTSNPVNAQSVTFSSSGSGYTLSAPSCSTASNGQCSVTIKSSVAQTVTITATFAGLTKTANVAFNLGAPAAPPSTFAISLTSLPAGSASALTVTVKDATGNAIGAQAVTFGGSGSFNVFTPTSGNANSAGVFTGTLSSTLAQAENVTASFGGVTLSNAITFTAASPNQTTSSFSLSPNSLTVGGTSTLTVTIKDAYGNPVSGASVTFTSSGTHNTFSPSNVCTTSASGVCTSNLSSSTAESKAITGGTGSINSSATVTFVAGNANAAMSSVTASPNSVAVNTNSTITVTVLDAFGNPVNNQSVSLAASGSNYTFLPASGTTNVSGVFVSNLSATTPQAMTVTATFGAQNVNTTVTITYPVVAMNSGGASMAADSCVILNGGGLKCWGGGGGLGYGDTLPRGGSPGQMGSNLPYVNLGAGRTAKQVAMGGGGPDNLSSVTVVLDNGQVVAWGQNGSGQLGVTDTNTQTAPVSVTLPSGRTAQQLSTSQFSTCAILDTNQVTCWGDNTYGQLGLGDTNIRYTPVAATVNLGAGRTARSVATLWGMTCAVLDTAQVKCWGQSGGAGQGSALGYGDYNQRNSPPAATVNLGAGRSALTIGLGDGAGAGYACALLDTHQIECWGDNRRGVLGYGDTVSRSTPPGAVVNLGTGRSALAVSVGYMQTCAVRDDGAVVCWGDNGWGELGVGSVVNQTAPGATVNLGTGRTAINIFAAASFNCALLDNHGVTCWGYNYGGELGVGDPNLRGDLATDTPDTYAPLSFY